MIRPVVWISLALVLSIAALSLPEVEALPVLGESALSTFLVGSRSSPPSDTTIALDSTTDQKPKSKKKKNPRKDLNVTPRLRVAPFHGPTFDQGSISAMRMGTIQMPWRHRMAYDIEWTVEPDLLEKMSSTPSHTITMDIHLVPLDLGRASELLLTRVPAISSRAKVHIRSEIPEGWYRLVFYFWQEPSGQNEPERIGVWRGPDAIKVMTLAPDDLEWDEYIATVSHETKQEALGKDAMVGRPESLSLRRQRQALQAEFAKEKRQREEFQLPSEGQMQGHGHPLGVLSRLWKAVAVPLKLAPDSQSPYLRTSIPQDSFQLKKHLALSDREGVPDFTEVELEEVLATHTKHQIVTDEELGQLDQMMTVWNNNQENQDKSFTGEDIQDDDGMDEDESFGRPLDGLSDLQIHIENGRDVVSHSEALAWRANRDRTVSWKTSPVLEEDNPLMVVDLIATPEPQSGGSTRPPSTRAELIQKSLEQPRVSLLSDQIPGSWGAVMVRIPSWVPQGIYQVRVRGSGRAGIQWADVSQPFFVQSDPYLYA